MTVLAIRVCTISKVSRIRAGTSRDVLGQTARPSIAPRPTDRDGCLPNVGCSCGSLCHGDHLVVPLGLADGRIGFATLSVAADLTALRDGPDRPRPTDHEEFDHA